MDLRVAREIHRLLTAGRDFALVHTLATRGSAPRHVGAWLVLHADGTALGTVGGGPLEARAIAAAREALQQDRSRLLEFVLTEADNTGLGMTCGGEARLLVQPVRASRRQTLTAVLEAIVAVVTEGRSGWLVTEVEIVESRPLPGRHSPHRDRPQSPERSPGPGLAPLPPGHRLVEVRRALVDAAGNLIGDPLLPPEASAHLAATGALLTSAESAEEGASHLYLEELAPPETAYIFGGGHCGQALAPLLATIGLRVVVIDDREEFASKERFPTADRLVVPPALAFACEDLPIDSRSYVIIMTRCHALDQAVLAQALKTDARYIGMIGSQRKVATIFGALRTQGLSEGQLRRVHAPIGLEIGAETPEEIALSIAAEIVKVRRIGDPKVGEARIGDPRVGEARGGNR